MVAAKFRKNARPPEEDTEGGTRGRVVSRGELAAIIGMGRGTVTRYLKAGMPALRAGKAGMEWELNTSDCIRWIIDRERGAQGTASAGFADARQREKQAQATLKEYQVEERRGTLVHVDAVREAVETRYAVVKSRLNAMPARVSAKVHDPDVAIAVERACREEVNQALSELSAAGTVGEAQDRG